jgi:hypothetical protein
MHKVSPNISNLIKEHTNKWLEKYSKKQPIIRSANNQSLVASNQRLVAIKNKEYIHLMTFVSLFSFILGFNCRRLLEQHER